MRGAGASGAAAAAEAVSLLGTIVAWRAGALTPKARAYTQQKAHSAQGPFQGKGRTLRARSDVERANAGIIFLLFTKKRQRFSRLSRLTKLPVGVATGSQWRPVTGKAYQARAEEGRKKAERTKSRAEPRAEFAVVSVFFFITWGNVKSGVDFFVHHFLVARSLVAHLLFLPPTWSSLKVLPR